MDNKELLEQTAKSCSTKELKRALIESINNTDDLNKLANTAFNAFFMFNCKHAQVSFKQQWGNRGVPREGKTPSTQD